MSKLVNTSDSKVLEEIKASMITHFQQSKIVENSCGFTVDLYTKDLHKGYI